jgi:hypothetical protein
MRTKAKTSPYLPFNGHFDSSKEPRGKTIDDYLGNTLTLKLFAEWRNLGHKTTTP